jgi:hypothetical protein
VLAVTGIIAHAEVEGLRAVRGPVGFVVELACVPDNLHHSSVLDIRAVSTFDLPRA